MIEGFHFIQLIYVPVNELFLNSSVKSLQVAIGLGMFRIIKKVYETVCLASLGKVFFEFTTIISLDSPGYERGNFGELPEEIPPVSRPDLSGVGIGEGKAGADINGGKDVALETGGESRQVGTSEPGRQEALEQNLSVSVSSWSLALLPGAYQFGH